MVSVSWVYKVFSFVSCDLSLNCYNLKPNNLKEIFLYFCFGMIFLLICRKSVKFNLKHNAMTLALFGIMLLSVVPAMFSGFPAINIVQSAAGQGEDPFQVTANETLTPAQQQAREQLLKEKGF